VIGVLERSWNGTSHVTVSQDAVVQFDQAIGMRRLCYLSPSDLVAAGPTARPNKHGEGAKKAFAASL
jgi:hypothetical protein